MDPDIHDTFGAHPSYPAAARRPHTPASSTSSPLAAAAALRAGASSSGKPAAAGGSGAAGTGVSANGWRQPLGAPRQAGAAGTAGTAAAAPAVTSQPAESSSTAAARAAAGAPAVGHPTVYPAHPKFNAALSPIGHTMMLDPTNVPGQHSITVHDPQASHVSLAWLVSLAAWCCTSMVESSTPSRCTTR